VNCLSPRHSRLQLVRLEQRRVLPEQLRQARGGQAFGFIQLAAIDVRIVCLEFARRTGLQPSILGHRELRHVRSDRSDELRVRLPMASRRATLIHLPRRAIGQFCQWQVHMPLCPSHDRQDVFQGGSQRVPPGGIGSWVQELPNEPLIPMQTHGNMRGRSCGSLRLIERAVELALGAPPFPRGLAGRVALSRSALVQVLDALVAQRPVAQPAPYVSRSSKHSGQPRGTARTSPKAAPFSQCVRTRHSRTSKATTTSTLSFSQVVRSPGGERRGHQPSMGTGLAPLRWRGWLGGEDSQ